MQFQYRSFRRGKIAADTTELAAAVIVPDARVATDDLVDTPKSAVTLHVHASAVNAFETGSHVQLGWTPSEKPV